MIDEAPLCQCPHLDPQDWDRVESDWSDIAFVKTSLPAALGVPVGFYRKRRDLAAKAEKLGATVPEDAMILLGEGRFTRPMLIEVDDAPDNSRDVVRPGGVAYTRLVEAPPGHVSNLREAFLVEAGRKYGRPPDDVFLWYLTCRECSGERNFETLLVAHYNTP